MSKDNGNEARRILNKENSMGPEKSVHKSEVSTIPTHRWVSTGRGSTVQCHVMSLGTFFL